MPALTSVAVYDGEDTPVLHTFVPQNMTAGVASFKETDGVPVGDNILTVSSSHGTRHKVDIRLRLPQTATQTVNGVPSEIVTRTIYATVRFDYPSDSTEQERDNASEIISNLLKQATMKTVVVGLSDFY
jgi:hypothetical protein